MLNEESKRIEVDAKPTKDFFIYMITRDIQINPAIVELIDNAIDGAKRIRPNKDYSGLWIKLYFDRESFIIEDNCGGIDVETASKYAFKFGRPSGRPSSNGFFTGVFGIGMKRALFKLGEYFEIHSVTPNDSFLMNLDVEEWMRTENWDFPIMASYEKSEMLETGTKIEIKKLKQEASNRFQTVSFMNALISYIEKYRSVEAENGLEIYINNTLVSFSKDTLLETNEIKPYKNKITLANGTISIVAGISHNGKPEQAGWYVYCNGRLVLFADKSELTGWGNEYKSYHPSLAGFRGYIYFESADLLLLPWNTTKTGVDPLNPMYVAALSEMKAASEQIFSLINSTKKLYEVENLDEVSFIKDAAEVTLSHEYVQAIVGPSDFYIKEGKKVEPKTRIVFTVPKAKADIAMERLGVDRPGKAGEKIFEYYFQMEGLE